MSVLKFTRKLFNTSVPAFLAYFSIMFIGDYLARTEKKPATIAPKVISSPAIRTEGYIVKPIWIKDEIDITPRDNTRYASEILTNTRNLIPV